MKNKKFCKYVIFIICFIIILSLISIIIDYHFLTSTILYDKEQALTLQFIENKLIGALGGVHTNFLDTNEIKTYSTGHEVLSESEGLILHYYLSSNDKNKYNMHFNLINTKMLTNSNSLRWRIKDGIETEISTSLDDLRVIRVLIKGYKKWGDRNYYKLYRKLEKSLRSNSLNKGYLVDFYDNSGPVENITISYLDLYTQKMLTNSSIEWDNIYNLSLQLIKNSYVSDQLPLYYNNFMLKDKKFIKYESINLIESLLTSLHLAEVNELNHKTIEWLQNEMNSQGKLLSSYSVLNGEPTDDSYESTAIYAIAMRICLESNNTSLYKQLAKRMLMFQVKDIDSEVYGGFADSETLMAYSFDNLQALLALGGTK